MEEQSTIIEEWHGCHYKQPFLTHCGTGKQSTATISPKYVDAVKKKENKSRLHPAMVAKGVKQQQCSNTVDTFCSRWIESRLRHVIYIVL